MMNTWIQIMLGAIGSVSPAAAAPPATTAPAPATQPAEIEAQPITGEALYAQVTDIFGPTVSETTLTGWFILFGGIFFGLAAGRIVQTTLRGIADRLKRRGWMVRGAVFHHASGPASLALFAFGLGLGFQALHFEHDTTLDESLLKIVAFINILAIGWFLYNLVELVDMALRRLTARSVTKLDDTVVTLLRKALRIFLLIMFVLFVAENFFGANVTAWLAGLGIAGLAVSLAAQDSIKNLFGSITVLISRPFGLGDRIVFGTYDGTVENISFRDTKIRTLAGHLITVPNMKFTDGTVENISARPFLARTINIGLTYDTPAHKLEEALQLLKGILVEPAIAEPIMIPDRLPRVFFNEFTADSLNLQVTYAYAINSAGRDWWTYQAHAEQINFKVLRALNEAGIAMAYRTQTLLVANDAGRAFAVTVNAEHERAARD